MPRGGALSTNKNTRKELARRNNKQGFEKELMQAKRRDDGAWNYHKGQLKKTDAFQNASDADKEQMLKDRKEEVKAERIADGKHHTCLKESDEEELLWLESYEEIKFPLPTAEKVVSESSDDDEMADADADADADEEDEEDEDDEDEEMDVDDENQALEGGIDNQEADNGEEVDEKTFVAQESDGVIKANADYLDTVEAITWQATYKHWFNACKVLEQKLGDLSKVPEDGKGHFFEILPNYQKSAVKSMATADPSLVSWTPPSKFFTEIEIALLQNLNAWFDGFRLPGPTSWWDQRGAEVKAKILDSSGYTTDRAREAWEMIQLGSLEAVPERANLLEASPLKLCMMEAIEDDESDEEA